MEAIKSIRFPYGRGGAMSDASRAGLSGLRRGGPIMAFPYLTRGHAPAPGAGVAVVSALIVLLALLAVPYHFAQSRHDDAASPRVEDWRGNSAALDTLR